MVKFGLGVVATAVQAHGVIRDTGHVGIGEEALMALDYEIQGLWTSPAVVSGRQLASKECLSDSAVSVAQQR